MRRLLACGLRTGLLTNSMLCSLSSFFDISPQPTLHVPSADMSVSLSGFWSCSRERFFLSFISILPVPSRFLAPRGQRIHSVIFCTSCSASRKYLLHEEMNYPVNCRHLISICSIKELYIKFNHISMQLRN